MHEKSTGMFIYLRRVSTQDIHVELLFQMSLQTRTSQGVQFEANVQFVWLVTVARKYDHVTSLLRDRHWLPITERIEYTCLCTTVPCWLCGTDVLRRSKERLAICGHSHSGSAENSSIVWWQSFFSRRPTRLEQSYHKCSLCPVNFLF